MGKTLQGEGEGISCLCSLLAELQFWSGCSLPVTTALIQIPASGIQVPQGSFSSLLFHVISIYTFFIPGPLPLLVPLRCPPGCVLLKLPSIKLSVFTIYYTGALTCIKQWKGLYLDISENIFSLGKLFNICWKKLTQGAVNPWGVYWNGGGLLCYMHSFESWKEFA